MINREQQKQLNQILEENRVILAYIFGSVAKEKVRPLSDFDIAIVFSKKVAKEMYFNRELKIAAKIGRLLKINRVDVVNLETINSPLLKYNAVFGSKPILVKDQKFRFNLERKIMQEYEDTKYLREIQYYYLKKHIQNGTFGKAPLSPKQEKIIANYVH